jgi:hypothetical protein
MFLRLYQFLYHFSHYAIDPISVNYNVTEKFLSFTSTTFTQRLVSVCANDRQLDDTTRHRSGS